jgi:hypothetical protein
MNKHEITRISPTATKSCHNKSVVINVGLGVATVVVVGLAHQDVDLHGFAHVSWFTVGV